MGLPLLFTNHSRSKLLLTGGGVFLLSILTLHLFFNVLSFDSHGTGLVSEDAAQEDVTLPPSDGTSESASSETDSPSADSSTLINWDTIYDSSLLPPSSSSSAKALPETSYNFTTPLSSLPAWQTTPLRIPLILRLAIISRPSEFATRKAIRELILAGLPPDEVRVHHRFFVGYTEDDWRTDVAIVKERSIHKDIVVLDMPESKTRMGEKRWRMLRWASESPSSSYDYYMSADTDAFIRLTALARRLKGLRPELGKPREKSVMWGSMGREHRHYVVSDEGENEDVQDSLGESEEGFEYPYGFAILLSSHLVGRLVRPGVVLPHRIHYPNDDVVVGNWVGDHVWKGPEPLDSDSLYSSSSAPSSPLTDHTVTIINDHPAFHDPPGHSWNESSTLQVSWDSVVIHHLNVDEMKGIRGREEFKGDWVGGVGV